MIATKTRREAQCRPSEGDPGQGLAGPSRGGGGLASLGGQRAVTAERHRAKPAGVT